MATTRIITLATLAAIVAALGSAGIVRAGLTINQIQYVDLGVDPTGTSPAHLTVVDCEGGIVTEIWDGGSVPRLVLQDPNSLAGWGAIQVKGWDGESTFAGVNVGDWVSLTDVLVEDYRGTTFLQFGGGSTGPAPNAAFSVVSTGNTVPDPVVVTLDQIAAPIQTSAGWFVADHAAEPYESMWLTVEDVAVTALDLGKNDDNYNLHNAAGDIWASDYQNADRGYFDLYHPLVGPDAEFLSVTGVLEQYWRDSSGLDYYQLLTTSTDDFQAVPEPTALVAILTAMVCLVAGPLVRRRRS